MKNCPKCACSKNRYEFSRSRQKPDGLDGWCKVCRKMFGNPKPRKYVPSARAALNRAAPELLEALEKAYLQILEFLNEGHFNRDVEWDAGYIVDAIAKAKGEI